MRTKLFKLLSCMLFAAACGDNEGMRSDGPPSSDAPAASVESRVWVNGSIFAANDGLGFSDGAPGGPFGGGTTAPIPLEDTRALDARDKKIVFGFKKLTIADADKGNPVVLHEVPGGAPGNVEITSAALSPDGTKVVFTRDSLGSTSNGAVDLYFMPTTPGVEPLKISPDRSSAMEVLDVGPGSNPEDVELSFVHQWSADSKYVAFTANLIRDNAVQVYLVDTSVSPPARIEVLAVSDIGPNDPPPPPAPQNRPVIGAIGALYFDSDNNLYFRARLSLDATVQNQIFKVTPAGVRTVVELPRRKDDSVPDAGPFMISPDGKKLIFSADAPELRRFDIYTAAAATPTDRTRVTELGGAARPGSQMSLELSPDGTQLAVVGNFTSSDRGEPHIVNLDGTTKTPRRLVDISKTCVTGTPPVSCPGARQADADGLQWTADGKGIYVIGELTTNNVPFVYRLDPTKTDQAPTLVVTTTLANGRAKHLLVRPIPRP